MTTRTQIVFLLLAAGCATAGTGTRPGASLREPPGAALSGEDLAAHEAARAAEARGDAAGADEGERARAEWAAAASGYAGVAARSAEPGRRVPLLLRAAELRLRAQRWDEAAETAGAVVADAGASEAERVGASRLVATAALAAASAAVKAGQLEKLDLSGSPRPETEPPASWRRVVEASDAYLARAPADPQAGGPAAGVSPAELALVAAEVRYAYGALDDARRRLAALVERWPSEAEVIEQAAPLLLASFRAAGDRRGHDEAAGRLRALVAAAAAPGERERVALARTRAAIDRAQASSRFAEAERLLADGRAEEAARAFEALAGESGNEEPANALHNAAVAWDRAGKPEGAAAARERILAEHAASAVAPENALNLAAHRSRKGEHEAAARTYERFLRAWPESPHRCVGLRNAASELDLAGRRSEAAARYLAFGSDERCARADPDLAARALVRSGRLFEAQAREAYTGAAAMPGVASPEAKGLVSEAKRRLRGL